MAFGDFHKICEQASVPICSFVHPRDSLFTAGVVPKCYARSIDVANTVIFQIGNAIINMGTIVLVVIIILNVKSKYTAIGRREMLIFFSLFLVLTSLSIVNDCGVAPPGSITYAWLVAAQNGLTSASCWALMVNGLLGFEIWEDGKKRSVILFQLSSAVMFLLTFMVSAATFKRNVSGVEKGDTAALFVVLYLSNAAFLIIYVASQIFLCLYVLRNVWALGALFLSVFFLLMAQILIYGLSEVICEGVNHYLDGLFFGTLSNTFAIMMIYKYWSLITAEDLEFSISHRINGFIFEDPTIEKPKAQPKSKGLKAKSKKATADPPK